MNIFESAKKEPKAPAKKKTSKSKVEVAISSLEDLAVIKTISKALAGISTALEGDVKTQVAATFIDLSTGRKPENFTGVEAGATASCELRKRSSRSVLSVDEQFLLAKHGISTDVIEDVTETYVINPKYKDDQALLGQVSKAISGIDNMPDDFITHQAQEARIVTTSTSLDEVFAQPDATVVAELLAVVGTFAVKPTLLNTDISEAIAKLNKLLGV